MRLCCCLFVLLLVLLVQLNCRLQFLEIKILLVSFTPAFNVSYNLLVEFDTPCINVLAISLNVAKLHHSAKVDLAT